VIVDVADKNFVLITGPKPVTGVRRRRANVGHLEPLEDRIEVERGASDEEVAEVLKASGKLDSMKESSKPAHA